MFAQEMYYLENMILLARVNGGGRRIEVPQTKFDVERSGLFTEAMSNTYTRRHEEPPPTPYQSEELERDKHTLGQ